MEIGENLMEVIKLALVVIMICVAIWAITR